MALRRLTSTDPRFKPISFREGFNLLVADTAEQSKDTDSRNGAGKSSIVELLHFALGMSRIERSNLSHPDLGKHEFSLQMTWPDHDTLITVLRSMRDRGTVYVSPPPRLLSLFKDTVESLSIPEWNEQIGRNMFNLPADKGVLSPRELLGFFIRRASQQGFNGPTATHPLQSSAVSAANISYLLGINWRLASRYQDLSGKEAIRKKLNEASKDPTFRFVVGNISELRGRLAAETNRVQRLSDDVARFRVIPEFEKQQQRAADIDRQIRDLRVLDAADSRNLRDLEESLRTERDPDFDYVEKVFAELEITLPESVVRRYDDVAAFHRSVVTNRRSYLEEELSDTRRRLDERRRNRELLGDEYAAVMQTLSSGGAFSALGELQAQLGDARADLRSVQRQLDIAIQLDETKSDIRLERLNLQRELSRDLKEREETLTEINLLFQHFAETLYGIDRKAYIAFEAGETTLKIAPHISDDSSQGISNMVIFCFDLTLAVIARRGKRGPDLLVHDSRLFDGVDSRQVGRALDLARFVCRREGIQYIAMLNTDDLANARIHASGLEECVIEPRLTDATEDGGVFGFRFSPSPEPKRISQ